MREMSIDSIRVSLQNYQRVVILKDKDSDRYLPIWIGANEADAIAVKLQEVSVPRPLTHDLLESIIQSLGAQVNHILVSDLSDDTFYAKIVLQYNGSQTEIDSRPSDAIALAVRTQAPIFAADSVIDKAGVRMDQDTGKAVISSEEDEARPPTEEELRSLSAFSDFIDSLDLEDLGEGGDKPTGAAT
ncbi:MAG: bifunctional nuclease family protein [Dehalococcoidia bacterium]|nr:bifunctional nuclease family protein [Dehalococcoidia bacterium]